jgi:hypothetical protein
LIGVVPVQYGIYYSSAFSQYSCYQPPPPTPAPAPYCGVNNYLYYLIECDPVLGVCTGVGVGAHYPAGTTTSDGVCENQNTITLQPCVNPTTGGGGRYSCQIFGGPSPPTEDAFIEWYWAVFYNAAYGKDFITGKFTFCASASYILTQWRANGGSYINPATNFGIPMFNPSNHNV